MAEDKALSVGGYRFHTQKDAQLAAAELKKIEYLEARIDYAKPDGILTVYEKAIHERIFKTPVGLEYLKGMREYLLKQEQIDAGSIPEIPLYVNFSGEIREKANPARNRIKAGSVGGGRSNFLISVILNVLLIIALVSMFAIALNSDNPNVVNYERAVMDKYAQWEQELTQRESAVREKERELKLETNADAVTE